MEWVLCICQLKSLNFVKFTAWHGEKKSVVFRIFVRMDIHTVMPIAEIAIYMKLFLQSLLVNTSG